MTKEIIENDPYKLAGVDIDAGNQLVEKIKKDVSKTHNSNVLENIGGFAGMYKLNKKYEDPILVACTDGVGTKVSLAQDFNDLSGIGQDLVAMCVNDLIVCGAEPLFFLDYYASSKSKYSMKHLLSLIVLLMLAMILVAHCLGGETAEMPGHYIDNNFDLAGFAVGCVDEKKIINNENTKSGDVLIGIESSGPHSNGFSLIRKIINNSKAKEEEINAIKEKVLKPTILYPKLIMNLINNFKINSISHITGGGLTENLPRSISKNLCVEIKTDSWDMPKLFKWLKKEGDISNKDMFRIFNCGIGMVLIVNKKDVKDISNKISEMNFKNYVIGTVKEKIKSNL